MPPFSIADCLSLYGPLMGGVGEDGTQDPDEIESLSDPADLYQDDPLDDETEETPPQPEATAPEPDQATAEAPTEETPEEPKEPEDKALPPLSWKPELPAGLYTPEEQAWLEEAQDSMDPKVKLQASQFMMNKTVEYNNKALMVAQAQMASIPQPVMAVHGPLIAEYINSYVAPENRGKPEAMDEAMHWAVYQRSKQEGVGAEHAFREMADLLAKARVGGAPTPSPVASAPAPPPPPPAPKQPIPAENRVPVGGSPAAVVAPVASNGKTRSERALSRIGSGLGIDLE